MSKRIWLLAVVIFAAGALPAAELFEDTVEKTVPLAPDGTFSLRNIDGSVEIYGSQEDQVRIVAYRKAFSPQRLNAIQVAVEAAANTVKVNTSAPARPRWGLHDRSGTVDYIVTVPQSAHVSEISVPSGEILIEGLHGAGITVSLGSGRLTTHNCFCNQNVRTEEGAIDVLFDWLEEKVIMLEAGMQKGNIRAVIPADASFRLHAIAEHGHVVSDFTDPEKGTRRAASEINESIGSFPQSTVTLRVTDGNIRVSELIW